MIKTTGHPRASAVVDAPMAQAMVHFLTHHSEPTLVVLLADWLPRNGRHWHLLPDVDALALSMEVWECGAMDALFKEVGIRLRPPRLCERPPARSWCPLCGGPQLLARRARRAHRDPTGVVSSGHASTADRQRPRAAASGRPSMRPREIVVLPGGLTIERVALGLFELTFASPDGVSSGLLGMWDLQQLVDELAAGLAT